MLKQLIVYYRVPLLLFCFSVIFFVLFFSFKNSSQRPEESGITFHTDEATSSANLSTDLVIDIEGAVVNPGVYSFTSSARVIDAVEKAGGFLDSVDNDWVSKYLNKAQNLSDGDKLYIPKKGEQTQNNLERSSKPIAGSGHVNINTATQTELESLPGVGEKTAVKIIEGRPYQKTQDLKEKKIVGNALYEKISELISTL